VQQIIPSIQLWDIEDETQLSLDDAELQAFKVNDDSHGKYLLNGKSKAPCALHAWGSQTRPCACGCRRSGFSCERLESKGLHGCIVRSAVLPDGSTNIRHLLPNEAMSLNTMDPVVDFGKHVRLTLSAVGQLAAPIQALWVFGFVSAKLEELRHFPVFDSNSQIQAYRSWLLMRCRQVWPCDVETVQDHKLLAMMQFWHEVQRLSLRELLFPLRWEGKIAGHISIASILDFLIRTQEQIPPTVCEGIDYDDEATPWFDAPILVDDPTTAGCMQADSCTIVFEGSGDTPIRLQPKCNATIAQSVQAHSKLVGDIQVNQITMNGRGLNLDHVMEVGQVITITLQSPEVAGVKSLRDLDVSPTAEWTQPVQDPIEVHSPPRKVSKFDIGQCPAPCKNAMPEQAWLDASPFLCLQGDQFLCLALPSITTVRHQFFRAEDRLRILDAQSHFMADDEMRFHLHALTLIHRDHQLKFPNPLTQVCVIDPLISSAWVQGRGFDCTFWAKDHTDIRDKGLLVITAMLVNKHWIPVFMSPVKDVLQVFTWDCIDACHDTAVPPDSITHTLCTRIQTLGWHIDGRGCIHDMLGPFSLFGISFAELRYRVALQWPHFVASHTAHRQCFQGLAESDPLDTRVWLNKLDVADQALFRKVLNGTHITQDGKVHCQEASSDICPFCQCTDSRYHRFWECIQFAPLRAHVDPRFLAAIRDLPESLICAGWSLAPTTAVEWNQYFSHLSVSPVPEIAFCEDVHLFTDGSCFDQHSSATRMAGWAVVQASCASVFDSKHSRALDWGVLPGLLQSAVGAEVYAIWRALQLVSHYSGRVFLRTDCEAVVKKFRRLLHGGTVRANSVHADLWSAIQQCIRSRQGSTIITRLAAHQNEEVAPSVFAAWCFRHNGLADAWAVFANFDRPNLFWDLRSRRHTALEGITQINRVVQQVLLRISQEVVRHDTPAILELPAHVASVIPFESWFPLPPLTIPCGAVRWYGDALVRIVSSWFWQTLHDSSECLKWVSHFQLYVDFQLATGHPGPIHCGQWRDGSLMPWLSLQGYGFKQRVRWFTKILKEMFRHHGIRTQMGYGLPLSHVLGLHTGMLAVPWPKFGHVIGNVTRTANWDKLVVSNMFFPYIGNNHPN
jgi:ribonuclease HI